ncbi:sensor histidine kinase [Psychromicrobium lacuslunae]|uniref:sensor histidine kinase n=1 Tax=Psychromicrobium lacuslunae TaxID=1618207 RepID=UPI0006960313|nr:histidine kinase [Psychromicrobium lacuslunae]
MTRFLNFGKTWLPLLVAVWFSAAWCIAEAGRFGGAFLNWSAAWPLALITASIGIAVVLPGVSLALTALLLLAQGVHILPSPEETNWAVYFGISIALGFIIWTARERLRWIAIAANVLFIAAGAYLSAIRGHDYPYPTDANNAFISRVLTLIVVSGLAAAIGLLLGLYESRLALSRTQVITQKALQNAETELVIQQERGRISRDLHDVLAHSLAVIAAQADGTRYANPEQPTEVGAALESIADSARRALIDAQLVIAGATGETSQAPQPGLRELSDLLDQTANGNIRLRRRDSGMPEELAASQQVAVYRIVQEGTANALKHGAVDGEILVHFDWKEPGLVLQISSELSASIPVENGSGGRGIPGMQERARLAGGWLSSQRDESEGLFLLTAFIPYRAKQQAESLLTNAGGAA